MADFMTSGAQAFIDQIVARCGTAHADWATIFAATYADTLKNTLVADGSDRIFVLTGDIPAMWQRDSTAQVRPYLVPAQTDPELADVIEKVIARQMFNMALDPYANAFNETANDAGHQNDDTQMSPWIWERKYELDSLCYPAQLTYLFWKNTGRTSHFDQHFERAIDQMIKVIKQEQHHETSDYRFERTGDRPEDTLVDGIGTPVAPCGLSWNGFRPSDDAAVYGYLIPANLFAVETLKQLAEVYTVVLQQPKRASELRALATEISTAIAQYGMTTNAKGEQIYAYEVDGLGNSLLMDDANVPNLLSLPYLGAVAETDSVYQATRRTILSGENPYYYAGTYGEGLGSPHTPAHYIWPIAKAMEGLTQPDKQVKAQILDLLANTTGGTQRMHEGFDVEDPNHFTREWFSWANMMFCELVMDYFDLRVKQA